MSENEYESVLLKTASHSQEEVNPEKAGDFVGDDGLLYCGVCGEQKQTRVTIFGKEKIVPCTCKCRRDELQRQKDELKRHQQMFTVETLRNMSLMSDRLKGDTFDKFERRPENDKAYRIARNYADNFRDMYRENEGLLFYGTTGTGKSFTAACIANELLNRGVPVIMTSFVKILQEIQRGDTDEGSYMARFDSARLLIIDDLGAERNTDYALEKVYNVIDSRVRANKPMILTTNISLGQMKAETDVRYRRVYDRVFEVCYPVQFAGRSLRMDEGNRKYAKMKNILEADVDESGKGVQAGEKVRRVRSTGH